METNGNRRLIDITLSELNDYLEQMGYKKGPEKEEKVSIEDYKPHELIVGLNTLADYLHVSIPTVQSLKDRGEFEGMYFHPSQRKFIFIKEKIDAYAAAKRSGEAPPILF